MIFSALPVEIVLSAVKLDCETKGRTIEIQHIRPDRVLTPEAQSVDLIAAQFLPELSFHVGWFFPQLSRAARHFKRARKP
jgi:hypothetical protein